MTFSVRLTAQEEAVHLIQWLSDPMVLSWFPMNNQREVEDAVRLWMNYASQGAALTAFEGEDVCGMANLYVQPFKKISHQALFAIIVDPNKRGQGVGSFLIDALERLAKDKFKIEILHLEVYEGNPAYRLYERKGFQKYGEHPRFIKEDGKYLSKIFMQKEI